jgi:antitoxin (DNA-binding transcriptional repressor) of toxin-antitoxin stability system
LTVTKSIEVQGDKAELTEVLRLVAEGVEVILTRGKTPVARVLPFAEADPMRISGLNAGSAWISDDFDAPLPDEFWTASA